MSVFRKISLLGFLFFSLQLNAVAYADEHIGPFRESFLGKAAEGYDVVSYFMDGKAVEGSGDHVLKWKGAEWRFSSQEHKEIFAANPEQYAPQYGGYCAYAVSKGSTASVDPEVWSIVEGKLYLNYSKSVQATWKADIPGYISSADKNWPEIRKDL